MRYDEDDEDDYFLWPGTNKTTKAIIPIFCLTRILTSLKPVAFIRYLQQNSEVIWKQSKQLLLSILITSRSLKKKKKRKTKIAGRFSSFLFFFFFCYKINIILKVEDPQGTAILFLQLV